MKYIGLFDEKEDIVTKEKLEAVEATIPTKTSQLDNDSGFITSAPFPYVQPDEPIDAPEFSLWVDTDEEALYIARAEGVGF